MRSNVNMNSWQCCTTHQELSISSVLKMCFMCLYDWACVCIERACKSLVICYLCIFHKCHPKGMCIHTHVQLLCPSRAGESSSNIKIQHKSSTYCKCLLCAPSSFRQLGELWENTSKRRLSMCGAQLISTRSIKFQSYLSHWALASDCGIANPDRTNKAAAVRPCLAALYNVSCDES